MDTIFQPLSETPSQFADARRGEGLYAAERRLLFAAFQTALQDCRRPANAGQYHQATRERWHREALEWLIWDGNGPLTIRWYADLLNLDLRAVRAAVLKQGVLALPRAEPRQRQVILRGSYHRNGGAR